MTTDRSTEGVVARRRGRPQQFPFDSTPMRDERVDVHKRVAWLLATSRILGDTSFSREEFLRHLSARDLSADSSRISRWEAGDQRVRNNVLAAYEAILGLPETSLVALTANLRRSNGVEQEVIEQDDDDDILDELFDEATNGTPSGADWLNLVSRITAFERFYLAPEMRTALSDRLLTELQIAVGHAQVTREAAAILLMGNVSAAQQMSRSLGLHILSGDAQVFRPGINLLRHVDAKSVDALALRLMSDTRPTLARAASSLVASKVSSGVYGTESLAVIEMHVLQGLSAPSTGGRALDAFDLVSRLPLDSFERIIGRVGDERLVRRLHRMRETGDLQPPGTAQTLVRGIAHAIQLRTPAPFTQEPDQMLIRLVQEALFHVRHQRRKHATKLLAASPYRLSLARSCVELAADDDPFVAARAWDILHFMGPCEGIALEDHVLKESRSDPRKRALVALGSSAVALSQAATDAIVELSWQGDADTQHSATYALGMTGSSGLQRLLTHPSASQRAAAKWWLKVGPAVTV